MCRSLRSSCRRQSDSQRSRFHFGVTPAPNTRHLPVTVLRRRGAREGTVCDVLPVRGRSDELARTPSALSPTAHSGRWVSSRLLRSFVICAAGFSPSLRRRRPPQTPAPRRGRFGSGPSTPPRPAPITPVPHREPRPPRHDDRPARGRAPARPEPSRTSRTTPRRWVARDRRSAPASRQDRG